MTAKQTGAILHYLRNLVDAETTRNLSDAQLLHQFAARREETAFAALVQRHGALVWGVCQHLLHHEQDAEDAFQATFLVLARRAGSIRKTEAVGSFLHGVAYRIALRTKQGVQRRQVCERQTSNPAQPQPPDEAAWRELQAMLDEEVARLPEKYRNPFVLCCLEGKSCKEAARDLCCKEGTVSSRLQRWDLSSGKPLFASTENWGHTEEVRRLIFSPNSRLLASSSKDQTVRIGDVSTTRVAHAIPRGLSDQLAFMPDGLSLLTVRGLGGLVVQDLRAALVHSEQLSC